MELTIYLPQTSSSKPAVTAKPAQPRPNKFRPTELTTNLQLFMRLA